MFTKTDMYGLFSQPNIGTACLDLMHLLVAFVRDKIVNLFKDLSLFPVKVAVKRNDNSALRSNTQTLIGSYNAGLT